MFTQHTYSEIWSNYEIQSELSVSTQLSLLKAGIVKAICVFYRLCLFPLFRAWSVPLDIA